MGADILAKNTKNTPKFVGQTCPIWLKVWDIVEKRLYHASVVRFQRHSTFLSDFHALKNGRTIDVKITCNAYFFLAGAHRRRRHHRCRRLSSIKCASGCLLQLCSAVPMCAHQSGFLKFQHVMICDTDRIKVLSTYIVGALV